MVFRTKRPSIRTIFTDLLLPVCIAALALVTISAQRPEPMVQSIDLDVPVAPVMFNQLGATQLVYELHVTNFLPHDIALTALRIRGSNGRTIVEWDYGELARRIIRPGFGNDHPDPQIVGPGVRAVIAIWLTVPFNAITQTVLHSLELNLIRPTGIVTTSVTGRATLGAMQSALLGPPLRGGPWVAVYDPLLKGGHRTVFYAVNGRARIPGRFAIDFVGLPPSGVLPPAAERATANGFGADVLAVAGGVVSIAVDGIADGRSTQVPIAAAAGNHVAIDIGGGRFAFYEHLQNGSVAVKAGDRVKAGQVIARLGSSGSTSIGPHLHFHVADASSTLAAEGWPFIFVGFEHDGAFESIDAFMKGQRAVPPQGRPSHRSFERPAPNAVIRFP
jgi:murein DD-endopeptidase